MDRKSLFMDSAVLKQAEREKANTFDSLSRLNPTAWHCLASKWFLLTIQDESNADHLVRTGCLASHGRCVTRSTSKDLRTFEELLRPSSAYTCFERLSLPIQVPAEQFRADSAHRSRSGVKRTSSNCALRTPKPAAVVPSVSGFQTCWVRIDVYYVPSVARKCSSKFPF